MRIDKRTVELFKSMYGEFIESHIPEGYDIRYHVERAQVRGTEHDPQLFFSDGNCWAEHDGHGGYDIGYRLGLPNLNRYNVARELLDRYLYLYTDQLGYAAPFINTGYLDEGESILAGAMFKADHEAKVIYLHIIRLAYRLPVA